VCSIGGALLQGSWRATFGSLGSTDGKRQRPLAASADFRLNGRFSPLTYCHDVVVSPHDPRVIYICLSPAAFSDNGSLYRSDDLAQTWRRIDHGIKADATLMAVSVHPSDPAQVYCVTRGGQAFATEDAGGSWREYRLPSGVEDVYAVACR